MGFRFQRRIRLMPWLRLNLSTRGVSASVGPRGADVNTRGSYNVGIPGTGARFMGRLEEARFFNIRIPEPKWPTWKSIVVLVTVGLALWFAIVAIICAI